jgi:hypothetical protein
MDRNELTATKWFSTRASVGLFCLLGFFYLFQPDWLGYGLLRKAFGGDAQLLAAGVGVGFFACAAQSWENAKLRLQMAELMEALHQLLYGKDYRRDREAIDILMTSLEGADPDVAKSAYTHLVRLTGQSFAQDPKVWRSWWETNKKTFEKKR